MAVKRDGLEDRFGLFVFFSLVVHIILFCLLFFVSSWIKPPLPVFLSPMLVDLVAPPSEVPSSSSVSPEPEIRAAVPRRPRPQDVPSVPRIAEKPLEVERKTVTEKVLLPTLRETKVSPAEESPSSSPPVSIKRPLSSQRTRSSVEELNRGVVDSALAEMARQVEAGRPAAESDRGKEPEADRTPTSSGSMGEGPSGHYQGMISQRALDLYRSQAAYRVQQNWVYAGQGKAREGAVVVFHIMRDGRVRDLVVQQSSGNRLVDESARRAILKSEPFPVVPDAIREERIGMGLRFTDKGVDL